jgi:hypothetical protein
MVMPVYNSYEKELEVFQFFVHPTDMNVAHITIYFEALSAIDTL